MATRAVFSLIARSIAPTGEFDDPPRQDEAGEEDDGEQRVHRQARGDADRVVPNRASARGTPGMPFSPPVQTDSGEFSMK